jgi:hypothetical protein
VFFAVFALAGLLFAGLLGLALWPGWQTKFWTQTPCVMEEARRAKVGGVEGDPPGKLMVLRYRYDAAGESHVGTVWRRGFNEQPDSTEQARILNMMRPGSTQVCWVNPRDPTEAVLAPPLLWPAVFLLVPLVFVCVGVGGVIGTLRGIIVPASGPNHRDTRHKAATGGTRVFGAVFTLIGGLVLYFAAIAPALKMLAARSWVPVECTILTSEVGRHSGSKGSTTYSINITYRYEFEGRSWESARYNFFTGSSSGYEGKAAVVRQYPPGARATCWVNPQQPSEAVLDRSPSALMLFGLLGLLFLGIGLSMLTHTGRKTAVPGLVSGPILPSAAPAGPVELKPSASPAVKLLGAILVAAFWNGIVGIFVGVAINAWMKGRAEWFLMIFLVPFVLIGLLLLGFVGSTFLNLFNPRVRMTINRTTFAPGDTLEVRWAILGRAARIQRLRLTCECEQKTTTGHGKHRRVERKQLAEIPIAEHDDPRTIAQGHAKAVFPANARESGGEGNVEIAWTLKARGVIPRFPDVEEDYPLTVQRKAGA